MKVGNAALALLIASLAAAPAALADTEVEREEGGEAESGGDEPAVSGEPGFETVVRERRPPPAPQAPSDFHLEPARFRSVPRNSAESLLTLAPGIVLRNHQGRGHASAIFLRGFDAGEGQDIEFRLEGIPFNEISNPHGHGYADSHFLIPELVESIRVVEGPFDPSQGDFAVAGSVDYRLGLRERGLSARASHGSYDEQGLLLLWGPAQQEAGTFVGVDLRRGDGFGPNRAHLGASALVGWEQRLGPSLRLRLLAHSHASRFDSAGVLRVDDYEAGRLPCVGDEDARFFCSYDSLQGGASSRHGFQARVERRVGGEELSQSLFLSTRRLRLRDNLTGALHDEPAQRGDRSEQQYHALTVGLRGTLLQRHVLWDLPQELELGYLARHDDGNAALRRLRRDDGTPYATLLDNDVRVTNLAAWAGGRLRPAQWLTLSGGLRLDAFFFDLVDRNRPTDTRRGERLPLQSQNADGMAVQPRLASRVGLSRQLDWIAAFGMGVRSTDAVALSEGEFAPFARVRALESGFAWRPLPDLASLRLVGFLTHVDRDFVFDERQNRNLFVGASSRHGALAALDVQLPSGLDVLASLTWSEAHLTPKGAGFWSFGEGPALPYVPRWSGRVDAVYGQEMRLLDGPGRASLGVGLTWVGARRLPLGGEGEAYTTTDLAGKLRRGAWELGIGVSNLFDARYHAAEFHYASHFETSPAAPSRFPVLHFAAAPPRMVLVSLALHLDTEGR